MKGFKSEEVLCPELWENVTIDMGKTRTGNREFDFGHFKFEMPILDSIDLRVEMCLT